MVLRHLVVWRIVVNTTLSFCHYIFFIRSRRRCMSTITWERTWNTCLKQERIFICIIHVCEWVVCALSWMCWHYCNAECNLLMQNLKPTINGFNIAYKIPCGSGAWPMMTPTDQFSYWVLWWPFVLYCMRL